MSKKRGISADQPLGKDGQIQETAGHKYGTKGVVNSLANRLPSKATPKET